MLGFANCTSINIKTRKSQNKIGSINRKSAKCLFCTRPANLTNYSCLKICGFALCGTCADIRLYRTVLYITQNLRYLQKISQYYDILFLFSKECICVIQKLQKGPRFFTHFYCWALPASVIIGMKKDHVCVIAERQYMYIYPWAWPVIVIIGMDLVTTHYNN